VSAEVIVFVGAVVASLLAHVAILASVVRRASKVEDANVPRPHLTTEIIWALIPALVLALVFTATWSRVREPAPQPGTIMKVAQ
jgi:heme/copper-type cytochrome/quinol oxidase subunit 2